MTGIFNSDIFNSPIFNIEEAEEEEVVGLGFAKPIDFVISPPYYLHQIQTYRRARAEPNERDAREFREMLQMYRAAMGAL